MDITTRNKENTESVNIKSISDKDHLTSLINKIKIGNHKECNNKTVINSILK